MNNLRSMFHRSEFSVFFVLLCMVLGAVADTGTGEDDPPYILVSRVGGLDRLNMDGSGQREILAFEDPEGAATISLYYDFDQNYVFYIGRNSNKQQLRRCSLTGENDQLLMNLRPYTQYDLQVDSRKRQLYLLMGRGRIFTEDYDASKDNHKLILELPSYADELAVGTSTGKLYWAFWRMRSIVSADMDGSSIKPIIPGKAWPLFNMWRVDKTTRRAIALDADERIMYFGMSFHDQPTQLRRVDLQTGLEETLVTGLGIVREIWMHEDHVYFTMMNDWDVEWSWGYWNDDGGGSVMRCHKSGSGLVTLASNFRGLRGIAIIQPPRPNHPEPVDGSWSGWGRWEPCSATCGSGIRRRARFCDNPAPVNGGSFCVGRDTKTKPCSIKPCPSYTYIVFTDDRASIKRMNQDGTEVRLLVGGPDSKTPKLYDDYRDIDYDANQDALFYIESDKYIRRCKLSGEDDRQIYASTPSSAESLSGGRVQGTVTGIAIRTDLQKIHVITSQRELFRYDYDGSNAETLISSDALPVQRLHSFQDIVIGPELGRIFITLIGLEWSILSTDLDGNDLKAVRYTPNPVLYPRGLALDQAERKLYFGVYFGSSNSFWWEEMDFANAIHVLDLDTGVESVVLTGLKRLDSLKLYDGRLYFGQAAAFWKIQSCDTSGKDLRTHFEDYYIRPRAIFITTIVDAPWSAWSEWTPCTATCGNGIRTRTCTGAQCYGSNYEKKECFERDCPASDSFILVSRRGGLDRMNMDGKRKREILAFDHPRGVASTGLDYDLDQNYVFYIWHNMNRHQLRRCSLTGENDQLLRNLTMLIQHDLQVDRRKQKLYRLAGRGRIFTEDYDFSRENHRNIMEIPSWAHDLAVGTMTGKLYWTFWNTKSIMSADIDGSDIKPIRQGQLGRLEWYASTEVRQTAPRALALAKDEKILYYGISFRDAPAQLRSVDLQTGAERPLVVTGVAAVWDIWPHDDYLYFTTMRNWGRDWNWSERWDDVGSVMRCHKSGSGRVTLASNFRGLRGIAIIHSPNPDRPKPVDGSWSGWGRWEPCSTTCGSGIRRRARFCDNPAPVNGGSFCVGPDTQTKACSPKTCTSYTYLLFTDTNIMRRKYLDGSDVWTVDERVRVGIGEFDYDVTQNSLYFVDLRYISHCKLTGKDCRSIYIPTTSFGGVSHRALLRGIALRQDTRKIYLTTTYAEVLRYDYDVSNGETLIPGNVPGVSVGSPRGGFHDIVISVAMGQMFLTTRLSENSIFSADLDGNDIKPIRHNTVSWPRARGLALDETGRKLYFGVYRENKQHNLLFREPYWWEEDPESRDNAIHVLDLDEGVETAVLIGLVRLESLKLHKGRLYFNQLSVYGSIVSCDTSGKNLKTHFEDYYIKPRSISILEIEDAPWSAWSEWTPCTASCGDGIRFRTRTCTGAQCYGQNYEIRKCYEQDCQMGRPQGWGVGINEALCNFFYPNIPRYASAPCGQALPASWEEAETSQSCEEVCAALNPSEITPSGCGGGLRLYPNLAERFARGEEQVHVWREYGCYTKWANICCCVL